MLAEFGFPPSKGVRLLAKPASNLSPLFACRLARWPEATCSTSACLHSRYDRIQPVMHSRCLSAAGFRFLEHPPPAGEFSLPHGRLTGLRQTPTGLSRSALLRRDWGGCPLYSGTGVSQSGALRSLTFGATKSVAASPWSTIAVSADLRQPRITEPQRGFTCVHPSNLPLARLPPAAGRTLGRYSALCTSPLPGTHSRIRDRQWTLVEVG